VQFLHPMWRDRRYPQDGCQTQDGGNKEGLQCAFPIDPARQQEIEPDQACVMGLDGHADRKAEDTGPNEPILKEAPDGHDAKTYDDSRGLPVAKSTSLLARTRQIKPAEMTGAQFVPMLHIR